MWQERRHCGGIVEWKLEGPLLRGQHRPVVAMVSDGEVYATSKVGYTRRFDTVEEAKAWLEERP